MLFDLLNDYPHAALTFAIVWAMVWIMDGKNGKDVPAIAFNEAQRSVLENLILSESGNYYVRVYAALLLSLNGNEKNVFRQEDWIMAWAKVADGVITNQELPEYNALGDNNEIEKIRTLLHTDIPNRAKAWAAIALGRLGYYEDSMIECLFEMFLDEIRSSIERDEALVYLVFTGGEKVARKLLEVARQKSEGTENYDTRERALLALMGLGNVSALREQLLHEEEDHMNRDAYAYALAGVRDPRGQVVLRELENHSDITISRSVKKALAWLMRISNRSKK